MKNISFFVALIFCICVKAQTYTISSPQNFTLGCGSTSVCTINFNPSPLTYTLSGPGMVTGTTSIQGSPTVNIPGTWTITLFNGTSQVLVPVSILQNTFSPDISVSMQTQTLSCVTPSVVLTGMSLTQGVSYDWFFMGTPTSPSNSLTVIANTATPSSTLAGTYTFMVLDNSSLCKSYSIVTIYQDILPPSVASNTFLCPQSSIQIFPLLTSPQNSQLYIYTWAAPAGATITSMPTNSVILASSPGHYSVTVTNTVNGCSTKVEAIISGCVGIKENGQFQEGIPVFPNPAGAFLNIKLNKLAGKVTIEICNMLGVCVKMQEVNSEITTFNIQDQTPGVYLIKVLEENKTLYTARYIKS